MFLREPQLPKNNRKKTTVTVSRKAGIGRLYNQPFANSRRPPSQSAALQMRRYVGSADALVPAVVNMVLKFSGGYSAASLLALRRRLFASSVFLPTPLPPRALTVYHYCAVFINNHRPKYFAAWPLNKRIRVDEADEKHLRP